jgi:ABC transporter substrate binding protein
MRNATPAVSITWRKIFSRWRSVAIERFVHAWFYRVGKGPRIRVPAPGTPDFDAEYEAARSGEPKRTNPAEIQAAMTQWGRESGYGLIVPSDPSTNAQRSLIIELAANYRMPTIYALRSAATDGGLMSYGVDIPELFRQAAIYADRILKGETPSELPVQLPTKFQLVVNLKTAKLLGLDVPAWLLATADEIIE